MDPKIPERPLTDQPPFLRAEVLLGSRTRATLKMVNRDPAEAIRLLAEWWRAVHNLRG